MTSKRETAKQEAATMLRKFLKPGDTVYGIVRSVSRSGMSRTIDFYAFSPTHLPGPCSRCQEQAAHHLHLPATECPGCLAPQDHHEYAPTVIDGPIDRVYLSGYMATLMDYSRTKDGALRVSGCGMNMIFATVYHLGAVLFVEYRGKRFDQLPAEAKDWNFGSRFYFDGDRRVPEEVVRECGYLLKAERL